MTGLIIFLIILLLAIIVVQIGKVSDLAAKLRGEEDVAMQSNNRTAVWLVVFMVLFLVFCVVSAYMYKDYMLGYGPNEAASAHGGSLDSMFNITLIFTGIVFIITQILLFWYAYKYRRQAGRKAFFFPHNNTLELIWTIVPSIVLTFLVAKGLFVWNDVMFDVDEGQDYMEIEATGYQFAWDIRYPGPDNKLGTKNYTLIEPGINPLGQDWSDPKNIDDFQPSEIVLPVDTTVRVRITSKDVLHNFYLPHFRVKMDAVPGLPTYFVFKPIKTTQEYREQLRESPLWQVPADPNDPEGPQKWETFDYELACAELCGKGHYSMRKIVKIVSKDEYAQWAASQKSYYMQSIRNTERDPFLGQLVKPEIEERAVELRSDFSKGVSSTLDADKLLTLRHVFYKTGSSQLSEQSQYEIDNLASLLKTHGETSIEVSGHTDNTGEMSVNMQLSKDRAKAVKDALVQRGISADRISAVGYGPNRPIDTNDTEEGRQNNRRTDLKILG